MILRAVYLDMHIDDIIFGISALSLGTVVAFTHGGTQPLFPHEAPAAVPPTHEVVSTIEQTSITPAITDSVQQVPATDTAASQPPMAQPLGEPEDSPLLDSRERDQDREEFDD